MTEITDYLARIHALQANQQRDNFLDMLQQQHKQASHQKPYWGTAKNAYLGDEGITIEMPDGGKVLVPVSLLKRLSTLITMAELARLLPSEPAPNPASSG